MLGGEEKDVFQHRSLNSDHSQMRSACDATHLGRKPEKENPSHDEASDLP